MKGKVGVNSLKMVNGKCTGVALMVTPNTRHPAKVVIEGDWGLDVMIRLFK